MQDSQRDNSEEMMHKIACVLKPGSRHEYEEAAFIIDSFATNAKHSFKQNINDYHLLHVAAASGNDQAILALLKANADPSLPNEKGSTPLIVASLRHNWETAKLIESEVLKNGKKDPYVQLIKYIRENKTGQALALLENKEVGKHANYYLNASLETPLHCAAYYGNTKVLDALIAYGATPISLDAQGRIPLITALTEMQWTAALHLTEEMNHWKEQLLSLAKKKVRDEPRRESEKTALAIHQACEALESVTAIEDHDDWSPPIYDILHLLQHIYTDYMPRAASKGRPHSSKNCLIS